MAHSRSAKSSGMPRFCGLPGLPGAPAPAPPQAFNTRGTSKNERGRLAPAAPAAKRRPQATSPLGCAGLARGPSRRQAAARRLAIVGSTPAAVAAAGRADQAGAAAAQDRAAPAPAPRPRAHRRGRGAPRTLRPERSPPPRPARLCGGPAVAGAVSSPAATFGPGSCAGAAHPTAHQAVPPGLRGRAQHAQRAAPAVPQTAVAGRCEAR